MSDKIEYAVIDTETTIKGKSLNKASAFWKDNAVVLSGMVTSVMRSAGNTIPYTCKGNIARLITEEGDDTTGIVVGHNIKFDLHHLRKGNNTYFRNIPIWDTQLAEYLITGQQHKFASLDELAVKYGGVLKDSTVSDMFKKGIGADEIPIEILTPYLEQDVLNTELIFEKQLDLVVGLSMLPLVMSQMEALLATTEMSYNGLAIDSDVLKEDKKELQFDIDVLSRRASLALGGLLVGADARIVADVNLNSNAQLATVIYGGTLSTTVQEDTGVVYKSGAKKGMPKMGKKVVTHIVPKNTNIPPTHTDKGSIKVDDDVLDVVRKSPTTSMALSGLIDVLKDLNKKQKQLSTYYEGVENSIYDDGFVHHDLNHCVAATGRLTSSNPNGQNMTNGPIKKVFVSRWEGGHIVEADYGQLEVIGLAIQSGDKQLIQDILDKVDIHTALYRDMYKRAPTKEERKSFKPLTFGLVYGAGAKTLASTAGVSEAVARAFVNTFYARYPEVRMWHDNYYALVESLRKPSKYVDESGIPVGASVVIDERTKRRYVYKEYKAPEWVARRGKTHSFSPTETKNYPVQGFSTGDVVPLMLGEVFNALMANEELKDSCLMVNTVHDSIMFDVQNEVLHKAVDFIRDMMENTPSYFFKRFGVELPFEKFPVEISSGHNWYEQEEVKKVNNRRYIMTTGVIQAVSAKDVTTKFGAKKVYSIMVEDEWFKCGFKDPKVSKGATVEFSYTTGTYGNEIDMKTFAVSASAPPSTPTSSGGSGWHSKNGVFPVPALDGSRSILRQNALARAQELWLEANETSLTSARLNFKDGSVVAAIISLARQYEAYTAGDLDMEEAAREVAAE